MKESKRERSSSSTKKKIGSTTTTTFDVVNLLNQQDEHAEKQNKRRKYDIQRSKAAQSQMKIHNSLLECRILIQNPFNQMNHNHNNNTTTDIFSDMGDKDKSSLLSSCNQLLINLLDARKMLLQDEKSDKVDYQSIITDDDDDDDSDKDIKQRKEQQIADVINKEYIDCRDHHWKEVLDRRHRDVRLHSGQITSKNTAGGTTTTTTQFKIMDSSFWEQVDSTVQYDIQRHRSATRQQQEQEQEQQLEEKIQNKNTEWKFDDSKLYQQYVKDFVMNATSGGSGGTNELSAAQERLLKKQQRKNASNMLSSSNSTKPIVDRKASKGRKIRYASISKLKNFTFPLSRSTQLYTDNGNSSNKILSLDEDEWFRSLFGGPTAWKMDSQKE